jgi:hypothetical protein
MHAPKCRFAQRFFSGCVATCQKHSEKQNIRTKNGVQIGLLRLIQKVGHQKAFLPHTTQPKG